jgi:YVTN family beta-propeller protein
MFASNCTVGAAGADATLTAGRQPDGSVILPGGRKLTPAGTVLDVGGFPLALRVLPGDRYVVVSDNAFGDQALRLVDLQATDPRNPVISKYAYPLNGGTGLWYGMALTKAGNRLYVSNGGYDPVATSQPLNQHYNTIDVFDIVGSPPQLQKNDAATLKLMFNQPASGSAVQRVPAGMVLSADETTLYVATQSDGTLAIIDLATGDEVGRAALPGLSPYDVAVDEATHTAFVSLWGGVPGGATGYVDGVIAVDVTDATKPIANMTPISTGKAAEAELLVAGKLYVANADADTVSIVDVAARTVRSLPVTAGMILGASPNQLALDAAANRLYVANAGENAVAALDADGMTLVGQVPTGWYPTTVAVLGDGSLVIGSAKGLGLGPTDRDPAPNGYMQGILQVVPKPTDGDLKTGDQVVNDNLNRPNKVAPNLECAANEPRFPVPAAVGNESPIKYVFLIIRENKTYDSEFGDLAGGNGSMTTLMFGQDITPNNHKLANEFVLLDNYYVHAEQSIQGHEWTTSCISNDYTEKAWYTSGGPRGYRPEAAFAAGTLERLPFAGSGSIFTHLDAAGLTYHNYGEIANNLGAKTPLDATYPGFAFNTNILDVDKAAFIIGNLNDPSFVLEPFSYIGLPNDHTVGTTPGKPTPQSMVADNDEATGQLIEAISHSKYWSQSIVFIVEDDVSDNGDHVEQHRSIFLAASPWLKRHYKTSVIYDLPSVYHTIELILGVQPMNIYDAHAAPLYELFSTTPDLTPYDHIPRTVPMMVNASDAPLADESARIDFSRPDRQSLGRILWKAVHGRDAEPPWGTRYQIRDEDD